MTITRKIDLQPEFNTVAAIIIDLVAARNAVYEDIDELYASGNYTSDGRERREKSLRTEYANKKRLALTSIQEFIKAVHQWDLHRSPTENADFSDQFFSRLVHTASSIGKTAHKIVVAEIIKEANSKAQTFAICSILADRCKDKDVLQLINDKVYSIETYYDEALKRANACLSNDDYKLCELAALIYDMRYKLVHGDLLIDLNIPDFTDEHEADLPYATSTAIEID
ncbi:MAG: hypothetical protein E7478_04145 [Ruminococcaceae bacterium]|nr:hypothetical protein [Oscillospiraceae bacterium]